MMRSYVLFGYSRAPGMAGDWRPLAVVHAETIEHAAEKIGCRIDEDEKRPEDRFVRPKRAFLGRVSRALVAKEHLRGRKRRTALQENRDKIASRYECFKLERMAAVR